MKLINEFIFKSFDEAMNVHKKLFEIRREKGYVTYADLYILIHPNESNCKKSYSRYGWTNLWQTKVEPYDDYIDGVWILKMPSIKLIKEKENK